MIDPEAETVCSGTIRKIKWEENTYKRGWKERIEDMTPSMPLTPSLQISVPSCPKFLSRIPVNRSHYFHA